MKYNIIVQDQDSLEWHSEQVNGEHVKLRGVECFIFEECEETDQGLVCGFNVSDLETGFGIATDLSKARCVTKAIELLSKGTRDEKIAKIKAKITNVIFPLNEMNVCQDCSGTGKIEIEDTNFAVDHNCAPAYKLVECPNCVDGKIEDEE